MGKKEKGGEERRRETKLGVKLVKSKNQKIIFKVHTLRIRTQLIESSNLSI